MAQFQKLMISLVMIMCLFITKGLWHGVHVEGAANVSFEEEAEKLHAMGLFQGTGSGFALERVPTRAEAVVMLVRLLGKEVEALATVAEAEGHPFSDVPDWAHAHVTYAYNHGLTNGMSATRFGSTEHVTVEQYCTFLLRALGYDDGAGDFHWQESLQKMLELGITTKENYDEGRGIFLRGHVVDLSYHALAMAMKDEEMTLLDKLVAEGAVRLEAIEEEESEEDRIIRTKEGVMVPVTASLMEGLEEKYWIQVKSEDLRQAFPDMDERESHHSGWSELSLKEMIDIAILRGWGPKGYHAREIEEELNYVYQVDGDYESTWVDVIYDKQGEPIAYTTDSYVSAELTHITFRTSIPPHLSKIISQAKAISEQVYYISHDHLYITYADIWVDGEWQTDETKKVVKIDWNSLPERVQNHTRGTQLAFSFNDDGSAYDVESIGNMKILVQMMQQSIFADALDDRRLSYPYGPKPHFNLGEYEGRWSLLFQFYLDDDDHILAYTYFTDDDYKAWAEKVQSWEGP